MVVWAPFCAPFAALAARSFARPQVKSKVRIRSASANLGNIASISTIEHMINSHRAVELARTMVTMDA